MGRKGDNQAWAAFVAPYRTRILAMLAMRAGVDLRWIARVFPMDCVAERAPRQACRSVWKRGHRRRYLFGRLPHGGNGFFSPKALVQPLL
jgi:hypothetical protein